MQTARLLTPSNEGEIGGAYLNKLIEIIGLLGFWCFWRLADRSYMLVVIHLTYYIFKYGAKQVFGVQGLNRSNIGPGLQQMGGKAVKASVKANPVNIDLFG